MSAPFIRVTVNDGVGAESTLEAPMTPGRQVVFNQNPYGLTSVLTGIAYPDGLGDGVTDNTVNLAAYIAQAIGLKTALKLPAGVFIVSPSTLDYIFSLDATTDGVNFGSLLIEGVDTGKRLNRIDTNPNQTYTRGTVIKVVGDMTGKTLIKTGSLTRNIRLRNITFVGTGLNVSSTAIQHNVSCSQFELDNCSFWHWGTAIDIGSDWFSNGDTQADFNTLRRVSVNYCGYGVKVNSYQATVTSLYDCDIIARIPLTNLKAMAGVTPSPVINVFGGFISPLFEHGGVLYKATISAAVGQVVTVGALTKYTKVRSGDFSSLSVVNVSGALSEINSEMFLLAERNCAATGSVRVPRWAVLNRVSSVNTGTGEITVTGNVDVTSLVGQTVYIVKPAIGFYGDNFNVTGTRVEQTQSEDYGLGYILAYLKGWQSSSTFKNLDVKYYSASTGSLGYNEIRPLIYHENVKPTQRGFQLTLEDCLFEGSYTKLEVDATQGVFSLRNKWLETPLVIDHTGVVAVGFSQTGDSTFLKLRTVSVPPLSNEALALTILQGKDTYVQSGGVRKRNWVVATSAPTAGVTGELTTTDASPPVTYRIGGTIVGYYSTTSISALGTINVSTDATLMTVDTLVNLYIGRVITIAGAGVAGATLTTRIVDLSYDGTTRRVWIFNAASTTVSGVAIGAVAPTIDSVLLVGTAASITAQLVVLGGSSSGDLIEFRRADGVVTRSYSLRVLDGELEVWDMTANRAIAKFSSLSSLVSMYLFGGMDITGSTEPTAPTSNHAVLWLDTGGAKDILKVRFNTGASQTIATEP